ncbi:hypothetical protein Nepgr_010546 [Nepenthes gracilis]|uniref:SPARK domain-containing protein n=1 Tax=Nepenthes gracilis TaxID=150966 RepID=A0AAD3SDD7_NEPGR|nr:hypothetical protein Nepgr_010546 [Nepenthes gracilis]
MYEDDLELQFAYMFERFWSRGLRFCSLAPTEKLGIFRNQLCRIRAQNTHYISNFVRFIHFFQGIWRSQCCQMVSGMMGCTKTISYLRGTLCQRFLLFAIWFSTFEDLVALQILDEQNHFSSKPEVAKSPSYALFDPIEISPAVIPHYPVPMSPLPPLYPTFPTTYDPILSGKCPVNFSAISSILDRTASDCSQPFAALVGNVICCPQFSSLLHIFQGYYSRSSDELVLQDAVADDCFSDIIRILASRGANSTIPTLCSLNSTNITGRSCPVKDVPSFEKMVNTSKLLEACGTVDPLKECCRPVCQPAIVNVALQLSAGKLAVSSSKNMFAGTVNVNAINDCKMVVYSWLSRKLSLDAANSAFRVLSACKINRVCPLDFRHPSEVVKACSNVASPSTSCCSSLNTYIGGIQKQMLITNKQAIICAAIFASILQNAGVMTNIYQLCDVDLKDFTLQAFGQQGCLLRSLPADVVFDNSSGYSFTCDLNDNTDAPWPSSSSMSSFSLCAEKSIAALPALNSSGNPGSFNGGFKIVVSIISLFTRKGRCCMKKLKTVMQRGDEATITEELERAQLIKHR